MNMWNLIPSFNKLLQNFKVFILFCFIIIISKNFLRINQNISNSTNGLWPDIYSENNDYKINKFKIVKENNKFLYFYSEGKLCMYSFSPCSNSNVKNLNKDIIFKNYIYWKD